MTIQQLSQEVGIGVDTLRIWERRYGFPAPGRDSRGHRRYSKQQVEELRIVAKLQSLGLRPGKIFSLGAAERRELLFERMDQALAESHEYQSLTTDLKPDEIERMLSDQIQAQGLSNFIYQWALPLIHQLDRGWTDGSISIAREHLISDCLEQVLKEQLKAGHSAKPQAQILFLTLSGERHKLGLLMAAALFHEQGGACTLLNEELPPSEIPQLANELNVDAVALSFSVHYSTRKAKRDLASLRNTLDKNIKLIAGGHAVRQGVSMQNLIICRELGQIPGLFKKYFDQKN